MLHTSPVKQINSVDLGTLTADICLLEEMKKLMWFYESDWEPIFVPQISPFLTELNSNNNYLVKKSDEMQTLRPNMEESSKLDNNITIYEI